jgi:hypothetical protein
MTTRDGASSIQGNMLRITPLNEDGSIDTSRPVHWTKGFISASFTPEFEDGEETTIKAADGSVCVSWKTDDSLKRLTFNLSLCTPDPETAKLLAGGQLLVGSVSGAPAQNTSKEVVGYSSFAVGAKVGNPVAIEIWSTANVGGKPGSPAYWHWVFPYVKVRYTGDREISTGVLSNEFTGQAVGNAVLAGQGLNDVSYGAGVQGVKFPAITGTENQSYGRAHYAAALANPFSYVRAGIDRIPIIVDSNGSKCDTCSGSWYPAKSPADAWTIGGDKIVDGVGVVFLAARDSLAPDVMEGFPPSADTSTLAALQADPVFGDGAFTDPAFSGEQHVVLGDGSFATWDGSAWSVYPAP